MLLACCLQMLKTLHDPGREGTEVGSDSNWVPSGLGCVAGGLHSRPSCNFAFHSANFNILSLYGSTASAAIRYSGAPKPAVNQLKAVSMPE
jgi:hypothetical protein